jgi:hypothetical protein
MQEADKVYEINYEEAFELRRMLLGWSYGGPDRYPLPRTETELIGRQRDLAMSLLMIVDDCGLDEEHKVIEDVTLSEWAALMDVATIEDFGGVIVSTIHDLIEDAIEEHPKLSIRDVLSGTMPFEIQITVSDLEARLGKEVSKTRISRELTALGISKRRKSGRRRYFVVSEYRELLLKLFNKYQLMGVGRDTGAETKGRSSKGQIEFVEEEAEDGDGRELTWGWGPTGHE